MLVSHILETGGGCGCSHSSVASPQDWLGGGLVTEGRKIHKVSDDFEK
jgi:hypothetical protein